jgi:hypothetical protein
MGDKLFWAQIGEGEAPAELFIPQFLHPNFAIVEGTKSAQFTLSNHFVLWRKTI